MNSYTTIEQSDPDDTIFTNDNLHDAWLGPGSTQNVILAEGWTEIGENVFMGDTELRLIDVPASVVKISNGAFMDARNLVEVIFEENSQIAEISYDAFVKSGLIQVVIDQNALDRLNENISDINSENIGSLDDVESFHTFREIPKLYFGENNYFYGQFDVNIVLYVPPVNRIPEIIDTGNFLLRIPSTGSDSSTSSRNSPFPFSLSRTPSNHGGGARKSRRRKASSARKMKKRKSKRRRTMKRK
jgi:hypothetical protein